MFGRKSKKIKNLLMVIQQYRWQLETAEDQLRDLGYSFAEKIDPEDLKRGRERRKTKLSENATSSLQK